MMRINDNDRLPPHSTVATIGMFDGVHLGHATLIDCLKQEAAKRRLQSLVITFDGHPQVVLEKTPQFKSLQTTSDRLTALEKLGPDLLLLKTFTPELAAYDSRSFMQMLRDCYGVAALVVGYNHRFGHDPNERFAQYVEHGKQLGIDVIKAPEYLGPYSPVSSTIIRGLIAAGRVADAMHSMARPYCLRGVVVHGFHNGRGIGFPTANIGHVDPSLILPHNGAYAVNVLVDGRSWQGMVNIGNRPTLANGEQISIEVNIFDFDHDIYGKEIALEFISFLRLEFKLGSIEELREQLTRDRDKSRAILSAYNETLK